MSQHLFPRDLKLRQQSQGNPQGMWGRRWTGKSLRDEVTIEATVSSLLGSAGDIKPRLLRIVNWEMSLLSFRGPLVDHECPISKA